jgi:hypothetical protein
MLQRSAARKKNKALLRSPTKKKQTKEGNDAFFVELRCELGAVLQRSSELFFVELRCSAAPSYSWSYVATRLRAQR